MSRRTLTSDQLLNLIERSAGRAARAATRRLIRLAESDSVGAVMVGRHSSMSARLRWLDQGEKHWLTLFVVRADGRFYTQWHDRWQDAGIPRSVAPRYQRRLSQILNVKAEFPRRLTAPVEALSKGFGRIASIISSTASVLWPNISRKERHERADQQPSMQAMEGTLTEVRMTRRGRSRRLRDAAFRRADGECGVCERNFARLMSGRGSRVLQVHHLKQLAASDTPRITEVDDLVVVCANCHLLIHSDPKRALTPAELRRRLGDEPRKSW